MLKSEEREGERPGKDGGRKEDKENSKTKGPDFILLTCKVINTLGIANPDKCIL